MEKKYYWTLASAIIMVLVMLYGVNTVIAGQHYIGLGVLVLDLIFVCYVKCRFDKACEQVK